jgi:competence protein ComEC
VKKSKLLNSYFFVWVAIGLIAGIVAFDFVPSFIVTLSVVCTVILSFAFFVLNVEVKKWAIGIVVLIFFTIGLQMMDRTLVNYKMKSIERNYIPGNVYSAEVLSISSSAKTWNKALMRVTSINDSYWRQAVDEKVLFLVRNEVEDIEPGDEIFCTSHIFPIVNKNNPGEFDNVNYWKAKGISNMAFLYPQGYTVLKNKRSFFMKWFNNLDEALSDLFETRLQPESVGVAKAIILGDRDHLDAESVRSFGNSGAMHVLAVSGLHVGLILAMLIFFFSKFPRWISRYKATIIAILIIWVYAFLTGFSASVFRAVVMFSMLTLAKLSGRQYQSMNILAASAVILLLVDHLLIFDLGFQLSYLAMTGIFLAYPMIRDLIYIKQKYLRWFWEGSSVALAAQLFTFPLTLYCFHQFPNYFLLSNIGLMILTNVILVIGVLFIVLHKLPFINTLLAWGLSISVLSMFYFVQWIDYLPGSVAKGFVLSIWQLVVLYGVLVLVFLLFKTKWKYKMLLSSTIPLVVCAFLVFQRMEQNNKNELVIFNDTRLTFTLKVQDKMYCFYEKDDYIGKAMYTAQSYEKTRSSEIEYVRLENEKETILKGKNLDFKCRFYNSHYELDLNGKRIQITRRWTAENDKNKKDYEVYMPWMELDGHTVHHLKTGAFVLGI